MIPLTSHRINGVDVDVNLIVRRIGNGSRAVVYIDYLTSPTCTGASGAEEQFLPSAVIAPFFDDGRLTKVLMSSPDDGVPDRVCVRSGGVAVPGGFGSVGRARRGAVVVGRTAVGV